MGNLLFLADKAITRFGSWVSHRKSVKAWRRYQQSVAQRRAEAQAKHRSTRAINARQQAVVHAALAGGRR